MKEREGWHVGVKKNEDGSLDYSNAAEILDPDSVARLEEAKREAEDPRKFKLEKAIERAKNEKPGTLRMVLATLEATDLKQEAAHVPLEKRGVLWIEKDFLHVAAVTCGDDFDKTLDLLEKQLAAAEQGAGPREYTEELLFSFRGYPRANLIQAFRDLRNRIVDEMTRK